MTKALQNAYEPVDASPVKSFFVSMLTRDIKLEEAILDLLDNCVDGILRSEKHLNKTEPYKGFSAGIDFSGDSFLISDNCGGIPWDLHDYAFHMGRSNDRPQDVDGTVGVYGIGMKRAIFKMGKSCLISTQNKQDRYEVEILPAWIDDEKNWKIPVKRVAKEKKEDGTTVYVSNLYEGIVNRFKNDAETFTSDLEKMIATHYAFIINKGFKVSINGRVVKPRPTRLFFNTEQPKNNSSIKPYIFKTKTNDGVEIFLTVGLTRSIPSIEDVVKEQEDTHYSTLDAGWTILCNDRAVIYCDRSELTGWGVAGIPRYHTQFIAISGIVEFKSSDASKLPMTTTKRGIDASSPIYLRIQDKMREGMSIFIDYTNKWKGRVDETKKHTENSKRLSFEEIKKETESLYFHQTKRSILRGEQFKPDLPLPKRIDADKRRIAFVKANEDIKCVAEHLLNDENADPSEVGEKCFDLFLEEAKK